MASNLITVAGLGGYHVGKCRNCASIEVQDIGFVGEVAPFFMKRVMNLKLGFPSSPYALKRLLRDRTKTLRRFFLKLYRPTVLIELQTCRACSFLQTKIPFSDSDIQNLYSDYRSPSYNSERIEYEPTYEKLAKQVGVSATERSNRVEGVTAWLRPRIGSSRDLSMLDYGGADGRFLPDLQGDKYVFEISDTEPVANVVRIESEAALSTYSYVQLAHVLEHVPHPLALVMHVCSYLQAGGYLYVEVPQEMDDVTLDKLRRGTDGLSVCIHEHINKYTPKGVVSLFKSASLEQVAVETEVVDFGWTQAKVIRGLARKTSAR